MPLSEGQVFAGYTILRLLGSGGMGEVYVARHPRLPREDALKVLPTEVSADPDYRARFIREADLAAKLWHPHIIAVHDRGESNDQLWIAMDYVDGTDASQLLASTYPAGMPANLVAAIVTATASALDYAHDRGLLHRDVKPANIMLSRLGDDDHRRILLADFGIARPSDEIGGLTTTNMTVGTVAYSAPEQLMGDYLDGRADQYALAATAYQLLTGAQLFPSTNAAVVISRHLNSTPPLLSTLRPELATIDATLARALSKEATDRYPRCLDFARALTGNAPSPPANDAASAPTQQAPVAAPAPSPAVADVPPPHSAIGDAASAPTQHAPVAARVPSPVIAEASSAGAEASARRVFSKKTAMVVAVVVLGALIFGAFQLLGRHPKQTAMLDGTYQFTYKFSEATVDGRATSSTADSDRWFGIRSACTDSGCEATYTELDKTSHTTEATDDRADGQGVYHLIDGYWVTKNDGKISCGGDDSRRQNVSTTTKLSLKSDGSLSGTQTGTADDDGCGNKGMTITIPVVATRIGGVPPGVEVADTATARPKITSNAPVQPTLAPVVDVDPSEYEINELPGHYMFAYAEDPAISECSIFPTASSDSAPSGLECDIPFPERTPPVSTYPFTGKPNAVSIYPPNGPENTISEGSRFVGITLPANHRITLGGVSCTALAGGGVDCSAPTGGFRYAGGVLTTR
jgi:serine/threonine protein kinase, bacterial